MSVTRSFDFNRSVVLRRGDGVEVLIEITPAYRAARTSAFRRRLNGALHVADSFWSVQVVAGGAVAVLLGVCDVALTAVSWISLRSRGRRDWAASTYRVTRTAPTEPGAVHRSFTLVGREVLADRASATRRAATWADDLLAAGSSVVRYPA